MKWGITIKNILKETTDAVKFRLNLNKLENKLDSPKKIYSFKNEFEINTYEM